MAHLIALASLAALTIVLVALIPTNGPPIFLTGMAGLIAVGLHAMREGD